MTLLQLFVWHREQAERFEGLSKGHQTTGGRRQFAAVTRRYEKQAQFHQQAVLILKPLACA